MISSRYINDNKSILTLTDLQEKTKKIVQSKVLNGTYVFEEKKCAICDTTNFELLAEKDRYGLYCPLQICKDCGLIQITPRMTQNSYDKFYKNEYRDLYMGTVLDKVEYFESRYKAGEKIFNYLKNYLPKLENKTEFKVLDVGCGIGGIIKFFKDQGYKTKGIDLGEEFIAYGKANHGLNLEVTKLVHLDPSIKYDLIIYSHVFEHLLDLKAELKQIKNLLNPNGILYIEVPGLMNSESFNMGYKGDFLKFHQNAHTYAFNNSTLNNAICSNGFNCLAGNDKVQAVYQYSADNNYQVVNNYKQMMDYLKLAEKYHSWYPFTPYNLKHLPKLIKRKINS